MSSKRAVLGIDAAWTATHASGVALIRETATGWSAVAVAPSYDAFFGLAMGKPVDWTAKPTGGVPDPTRLVAATRELLRNGERLACVAVDMPLATVPITGFRVADRAVGKAFGAMGAAVLPPSAAMPGEVSVRIRVGFAAAGFRLAVAPQTDNSTSSLIEVYPCAAVVRLLGAKKRIPYKTAKARQYWPDGTPAERRRNLRASWRKIVKALDRHIAGIAECLPDPGELQTGIAMKAYEDAMDAVVCAWVGVAYLTGTATAYGDGSSAAIWIPNGG